MPTCRYKHNWSSTICPIQCFSIKQAAVWLNTSSITRLLCGSLLFHRLALKEDDAFNRLLSPSNHHFITILDFCSLSMNNPQTAMYSGRAKEQVYCTAVYIRPDVNLSPACDVRSASVFVALPSYPLMSLATVSDTPSHPSVPEIVFYVDVFPV